jgi:hypothetical protein
VVIDKLHKSLDRSRVWLDDVERRRRNDRIHLGYALPACTVAGALAVLTTSTWRSVDDSRSIADEATTLWGLLPEGWQAVATLALVTILAIGTVVAFISDTGRGGHWGLAVVAVTALFSIAFLVGRTKTDGWYAAEHAEAGAGRWLAGLACITLAVIHSARASDLASQKR